MFSKKNTKRGFTLIEMLIVIVIIGILAAALIPRLSSARGRANDVARKADLAQVAAALVAYQIDHGSFPKCVTDPLKGCPLNEISNKLISAGMDGVPSDIDTTREVSGIEGGANSLGQYAYIPITKRGIPNNGFVLMAATQTAGGSNWIAGLGLTAAGDIKVSTDYTDIKICTDIESTSTDANNRTGYCTYKPENDNLRYIYLY